ncbi:MAG: hypothetical protein FWD48_08745 [Oscillospiraceae bacterium]|nr:hypothetical protein [Oscillospiraceae bacterium]
MDKKRLCGLCRAKKLPMKKRRSVKKKRVLASTIQPELLAALSNDATTSRRKAEEYEATKSQLREAEERVKQLESTQASAKKEQTFFQKAKTVVKEIASLIGYVATIVGAFLGIGSILKRQPQS